jgi:hypothetical protein
MNRSDLLGLINVCDAYISLHRAEGFGRTLAEAMLLKKTVISTEYSGNVDFMRGVQGCHLVGCNLKPVVKDEYHWIEESDNALWAEVDITDAILKVKKAFTDKKEINTGDKFNPKKISDVMLRKLKNYD